jgi:polyhydroxyalkanoate synthesis repressor PhaR
MNQKETEPRIIKKYPNRRLYDTDKSQYITLEDLKQYVMDSTPFKVIDVKTEEDVTKTCLIQIIVECEATHNALFTNETLEQIVRFYENPMQKLMKDYLEQVFQVFKKPNAFGSVKPEPSFSNPFPYQYKMQNEEFYANLNKLTLDNMNLWQSFLEKKK